MEVLDDRWRVRSSQVADVIPIWGQGLGTCGGRPEELLFRYEATKKAICWLFLSPLTDSNR